MSLDTCNCEEMDTKRKLQVDADDISYRFSCGLKLLSIVQESMACDGRQAAYYEDAVYGAYDYLCLLNEELESAIGNEYRKGVQS